jgi:5-methylcytosine-specific restriction endonuclease McrA
MKCELCGTTENLTMHHAFSKTKVNVKLYPEYIHDQRNIIIYCLDCHLNKPIIKFSERQFCQIMGIEMRSKLGTRK